MNKTPFTWMLVGPLFVPSRFIDEKYLVEYPEFMYDECGYLWRGPVTIELESMGMRCLDPYSSEVAQELMLRGTHDGYKTILELGVHGVAGIIMPYHVLGIPDAEAHLKVAMESVQMPFVIYPTDLHCDSTMRRRFSVASCLEWLIFRCAIIKDYFAKKGAVKNG